MARTIPLTKGASAKVDAEDYPRLTRRSWHLNSNGYAARSEKRGGAQRAVLMHREVIGAPPDAEVDHIDGDPLNNTRANLRLASRQQNVRNSRGKAGSRSRFKGVDWDSSKGRWRARIRANGRQTRLGCYATEEEAARAYDRAAVRHHGAFARLNFPAEA